MRPASSHKGFELAEREKLLTGQLQDRWMGRGMKREVIRDLQGKKVIHSEVQISIYLVSSYQVWFLVTLPRDNSVASVSFSAHTHRASFMDRVPHSKRWIRPNES